MDEEHHVEVGRLGRVRGGDDCAQYVLVHDDRGDSGGYFIHTGSDRNVDEAFDDWVPDESSLRTYFEFRGWTIEWL